MALRFEVVDESEHEALPRRAASETDREWGRVMGELMAGRAVRIQADDDAERRGLARSVGRRAAHRGFKVDIRHGDGFLSVRKVGDVPLGDHDTDSEPTKSGLWGDQETVVTEQPGSAS
jgi:hypothetical protein